MFEKLRRTYYGQWLGSVKNFPGIDRVQADFEGALELIQDLSVVPGVWRAVGRAFVSFGGFTDDGSQELASTLRASVTGACGCDRGNEEDTS
jgi:hypothetical protein